MKNRSVSGNLHILNSLIQHHRERKLYILFTDLKKCFDKLWLEDAIAEMMINGMTTEDADYLYETNDNVKAIVSTPAGESNEFHVEKIVKQGTVAGPMMAGVSTDKINRLGSQSHIIYYGMELKHPAFVDDVLGMGTH